MLIKSFGTSTKGLNNIADYHMKKETCMVAEGIGENREYLMYYRGPGGRMIWLLPPPPLIPLPSANCLSFSVFMCAAVGAY
jgi:hypothetical protein